MAVWIHSSIQAVAATDFQIMRNDTIFQIS